MDKKYEVVEDIELCEGITLNAGAVVYFPSQQKVQELINGEKIKEVVEPAV